MKHILALLASAMAGVHAYSNTYKLDKLNKELAGSRGAGYIKLDVHGYSVMVADEPRNYSVVLLTTAMDERFGCQPCRAFDSAFKAVAGSYARMGVKNELYFAYADFSTAREIFEKLQLQSAPNVMHFPPTEGPRGRGASPSPDRYEIASFESDDFAEWVTTLTGQSVKVAKPIDYMQLANKAALAFFVLAVMRLVYSRFHQLVNSTLPWAAMVLVFSTIMNSGFMWNQIRHPPYSGVTRDGRPQFIADGFQNQFQAETQIIAALYAASAAAVVFLVQRVPSYGEAFQQRYAVYAGLTTFFLLASILIGIFRLKNGGYPFKLLL